jgi:hypothetical protein
MDKDRQRSATSPSRRAFSQGGTRAGPIWARSAVALGAVALLVGCAGANDPLASYPTAGQQMRSFYEAHGLERSGTCTTPYISDVVRVEPVREDERQIVLDVDYLYDSHVRPAQYGLAACWNFASRRFTFDKTDSGLRLTGMTGEQRPG